VLIPLYVVQDEYCFIPRRQLVDGPLEIDAVQRTRQPQIRASEIAPGRPGFLVRLGDLLERSFLDRLLPQLHQNHVYRKAVKPCGKRRLAAKCGDLSEELEERFLRQILCLGRIPHHSKAQRIHSAAVQLIQTFEGRRIALLGKPDRLGFRNVPTFGSSRSGHATRRDASFSAMRQPLWKLYNAFLPDNTLLPSQLQTSNPGQRCI